MARLVSCSKCGRIHPAGECSCAGSSRPRMRAAGPGNKIDKFRSSYKWTCKARQIKDRDHYLCVACLHDIDGSGQPAYTTPCLEVHHIVSLESDFNLRLDDSNLITLCRYHHERAEQGLYEISLLRSFVSDD